MIRPAKISAIIPTYNCGRYIAEAIESVLGQTLLPQEILVVDDGSTDCTPQALEPYRSRIRYFYQDNRGEPAARNCGIHHATGELIAFLDADDLWLPEKLQLQMEYIVEHPDCGLVYTDMKIFNESGIVHESVKEWLGMTLPTGRIFPQLFWETLFGSGTVVCRRACFEEVGLFDETFQIGSDYEMWLRMARRFEFGCVDMPLLMYRQHPNMATRMPGREMTNGIPWEARVVQKILDLYPEIIKELGRTTVQRRLAKPYLYLACSALDSGDHRQARQLLRHALRRWPTNLRYQTLYFSSFLTPSQLDHLRNFYHRLSSRLERREQIGRASHSDANGASQTTETTPSAATKGSLAP